MASKCNYEIPRELKPYPKSRFLPGEVDPREDRTDFDMFLKHRINVTFAKSKVDNEAPKFNVAYRYNTEKLNKDARDILERDKQNLKLIYNINYINVVGGKVKCWNLLDSSLTVPRRLRRMNKLTEQMNLDNQVLRQLIKNAQSKYPTGKLMGDWRRAEKKIKEQSKYPLWTKEPRFMTRSLSIGKISSLSESSKKVARTRCFVDIELAEEKQFLGRLILELYSDYAPKTCANFEALCRGTHGYCYKGTPFHRIVPDYWCQGGDVTKFDGSGGISIYGDTFEDENFDLSHIDIGVLSMWSNGPNTNNSKFNITFKCLETMDKCRVVFGRVIYGLQYLQNIQYFGTKYGKPLKKIIISNCGVIHKKEN